MKAFDSGFQDDPIHPLDCLLVQEALDLGHVMFNGMLFADQSEDGKRGLTTL
jgi:hypothetical protein